MAGLSEDRDRQVVPRWRSFASSLRHGDLGPLHTPVAESAGADPLEPLQADWGARRGISSAADLVSVAFILGREAEVIDAARFLVKQDATPQGARGIAILCLDKLGVGPGSDPPRRSFLDPLETSFGDDGKDWRVFAVQIHEARSRLADYPHNPVLWSDLARLHTSVGSHDKAGQAMKVALAMAPRNRFILRASSRFFLHQGDRRTAHRVLADAESLRFDPWILSAEIATAAASNKTSKHIKVARRLLESGSHSPHHLSELASALGTLEAVAGNRKAGRRLIAQSLRKPSENAIAQAAWLERNAGIETSLSSEERICSAEAGAWYAFRDGDWDQSLDQTRKWWEDQPFSSRPAIHGSHVASTVLEDYELAARFATQGLLANPGDAVLYNNLAFSSAMKGDLAEAVRALQHVDLGSLPPSQKVVMSATWGLVYFRSGNPDLGRRFYQDAISFARLKGDPKGIIARLYLAQEEVRIGSEDSESIKNDAIHAARSNHEPWVQLLIERLQGGKQPPSGLNPLRERTPPQ
jgi:tetratricopeptide (TPR) repeat protein